MQILPRWLCWKCTQILPIPIPSKVFCKYPLFKVAVVVAACVQINGWLRPGCCLLLLYTYYVAIYCNSAISDHIAIHWLWSSWSSLVWYRRLLLVLTSIEGCCTLQSAQCQSQWCTPLRFTGCKTPVSSLHKHKHKQTEKHKHKHKKTKRQLGNNLKRNQF